MTAARARNREALAPDAAIPTVRLPGAKAESGTGWHTKGFMPHRRPETGGYLSAREISRGRALTETWCVRTVWHKPGL
jgi:hypothetical protein